jgi:ankyrin repeat protein
MVKNLPKTPLLCDVADLITVFPHSGQVGGGIRTLRKLVVVDQEKLMAAAESGDLSEIQALSTNGLHIDSRDRHGTTALMMAALWNRIEVVRHLVAMGADVNARDFLFHSTALMFAALAGNSEIVKLLLEEGALPDARTRVGSTALMVASRGNHAEVVKILLAYGADISCKDRRGFTALTEASRENCPEVVRLLLINGADASTADYDGRTPLFWATLNGNIACAKLLLEWEAQSEAVKKGKESSLSYVGNELVTGAGRIIAAPGENSLCKTQWLLTYAQVLAATEYLKWCVKYRNQ